MVDIFLFGLVLIATLVQILFKKQKFKDVFAEVLLSYIFLFNVGLLSLTAAYMHVFMGPEVAKQIGWQPGSPFQYEIGMANLSYGFLGVLCFWIRGRFWDATAIGWSILLLGCFVGHVNDYYVNHNDAPYNIGLHIWIYDLFLPIFVLSLLAYLRKRHASVNS